MIIYQDREGYFKVANDRNLEKQASHGESGQNEQARILCFKGFKVTNSELKEIKMGLTEKSFLERWAEMGITPTKRDNFGNKFEEEKNCIKLEIREGTEVIAMNEQITYCSECVFGAGLENAKNSYCGLHGMAITEFDYCSHAVDVNDNSLKQQTEG